MKIQRKRLIFGDEDPDHKIVIPFGDLSSEFWMITRGKVCFVPRIVNKKKSCRIDYPAHNENFAAELYWKVAGKGRTDVYLDLLLVWVVFKRIYCVLGVYRKKPVSSPSKNKISLRQ